MRIAHVVPRGEQPWSGVLTVIVELAAALARRGHAVEVWQLHDWDPRRYAERRSRLLIDGVEEVRVRPTRGVGDASGRLSEQRAIDIVHLHGAFNRWTTAVSRGLRRPYVFSPHSGYDPVSLRRSSGKKRIYRVLFERAMLRRAAMIVALTDVELEDCRRFGATGPFHVIPNGVAPPPSDLDRTRFRAELGLGDEVPLAVFVGRLDVYRKGLDLLVEGCAAASPWHVALVGPNFRDVDELERRIANLRVGDRVHLPGERLGRPVLEAMAAADVFTLLSRWEGLPMSLLEALSVGTPAVVSRAVERVVGVEAAGAGWAVNPDQLSRLLLELARSPRHDMEPKREAATALARRYDWDEIAERYERAYGSALAGP